MKFGQVLGLREKQNFLTPTFFGFSRRFMTPRIRFSKKKFYVRLSFRISGFRMCVGVITLLTDVVESSLISRNVGILNTKKWFEDEHKRSYRFGVMSKNVKLPHQFPYKIFSTKFQVASRELVSSAKL